MKQFLFELAIFSAALYRGAHSFANLPPPRVVRPSLGNLDAAPPSAFPAIAATTTSGVAAAAAAAARSTTTALSMAPAAAAAAAAATATTTALITLDQLLGGFTVGTTLWFFFVQSPFLLKVLGKEKFTPTMMKLTQRWSETMFVSASALLLLDLVLRLRSLAISLNPIYALLGWAAIAANRFVVVPRALRAGWRSQRERRGDDSKDVASFAVKGGSRTDTKVLHQTVVLLVLVMSGALLGHLHNLSTLMA